MKVLTPEMVGKKVFIYWNLHKQLWSVKDTKTQKVIGHAESVMLTDCTFKVSEAGRQRVLREKRKNVHAGVVGTLTGVVPRGTGDVAYYNPYKQDCFTVNGKRIDNSPVVRFYPDRTVVANNY
jgi:hypothetical protein